MDKKILVLVDIQKSFYFSDSIRGIPEKVYRLVKNNNFDYVIVSKYANYNNDFLERILWREGGTYLPKDRECLSDIVDEVISKNSSSCVGRSFLQTLQIVNKGTYPKNIYIAGVGTGASILMSVIDLLDYGIKPLVIADCCGSSRGYDYHEAGLTCLEALIGKDSIVKGNSI